MKDKAVLSDVGVEVPSGVSEPKVSVDVLSVTDKVPMEPTQDETSVIGSGECWKQLVTSARGVKVLTLCSQVVVLTLGSKKT